MKLSKLEKSDRFVKFCISSGHFTAVSKDIKRKQRQHWCSSNWNLNSVPENHVNDKRKYYREEYLNGDHWKRLRAEKIKLNPKCEKCGIGAWLDIHHLNYRNLYDVTLLDLQTLCRPCHNLEHKR